MVDVLREAVENSDRLDTADQARPQAASSEEGLFVNHSGEFLVHFDSRRLRA